MALRYNINLIIFSVTFIILKLYFMDEQHIFNLLLLIVLVWFFRLKANNQAKSILLLLIVMEFMTYPIPTEITVYNIAFSFSIFLILLYSLFSENGVNIISDETLIIFILISTVSASYFYYSYVIKQINIISIINSILPLSLILLYIFIYNLLRKGKLNTNNIMMSFVVWGLLYSLNNIALFIFNVLQGQVLYRRITLLDYNTLSPIPLFLSVLSVFFLISDRLRDSSLLKKSTWLLLLIISAMGMVVTQTRSMILSFGIVTLIIIVYNLFKFNLHAFKNTIVLFFFIGSLFAITVYYVESVDSIINSIFNRFSMIGENDSNVTVRFDEYEMALEVFRDNPFLGGGAGIEFNKKGNVLVNYVHNLPVYLLANFGLLGTVLIALFFLYMTMLTFKNNNKLVLSLYLSLISLIIYSMFFAIYKWFSFTISISLFIAVLFFEKKVKEEGKPLHDEG